MAELTLIEGITSTQVITEVERNLMEKMPEALPAFRMLVNRSLKIVEDPDPAELVEHAGSANPVDLPILVAAIREECSLLATFNLRHYQPGDHGFDGFETRRPGAAGSLSAGTPIRLIGIL